MFWECVFIFKLVFILIFLTLYGSMSNSVDDTKIIAYLKISLYYVFNTCYNYLEVVEWAQKTLWNYSKKMVGILIEWMEVIIISSILARKDWWHCHILEKRSTSKDHWEYFQASRALMPCLYLKIKREMVLWIWLIQQL